MPWVPLKGNSGSQPAGQHQSFPLGFHPVRRRALLSNTKREERMDVQRPQDTEFCDFSFWLVDGSFLQVYVKLPHFRPPRPEIRSLDVQSEHY